MDERELTELAGRVRTLGEYFDWELRCDECVRRLRDQCREIGSSRAVTGRITTAVARIVRLEGARSGLRRRFAYVGAGHSESSGLTWTEVETAFRNRVLTGAVVNREHVEPRGFLENARDMVLERVRESLGRLNSVKVNTVFNAEFVVGDKTAVKTVTTKNHGLLPASDLPAWYNEHVLDKTLADEFQERDSGWALSKILNLTVNVNKYNPMRAGCQVQLPREIVLKRAVINVLSTGNACFTWAVVAALYPATENTNRIVSYPHYSSVLKLGDVDFPMTLDRIGRFERANDVSINVFVTDDEQPGRATVVPLRLTDRKRDRHVNLLYTPDTREGQPGHFAWIKNLSRLVSAQLSKKHGRKYICDR